MNDPNLLILAGGISSRMKKSIEVRKDISPGLKNEMASRTKAMITFGEEQRPFLDYLLFNAKDVGYRDVLIVVSDRDTSMREYYGVKERDNEFKGLRISYAVQTIPSGRTKPLGTADAVVQALRARQDWRGKKFTVCNSDNLYSRKALDILLKSSHINAMIDYDRKALGFDLSRISQFSVTQKDEDGYLTAIIEKPTDVEIERAKGKTGIVGVSMNIFRLDYDMVSPFVETVPLHPVRQEKELPAAVTLMVRQFPKSLYTFPLAELVPDMTSIEDVEKVKTYLSKEFTRMDW